MRSGRKKVKERIAKSVRQYRRWFLCLHSKMFSIFLDAFYPHLFQNLQLVKKLNCFIKMLLPYCCKTDNMCEYIVVSGGVTELSLDLRIENLFSI